MLNKSHNIGRNKMDKLMYEGLANIGDTIRGYDWTPCEERESSYIEGVVTAMGKTKMGFDAYTIKLTKRVLGGNDKTNSRGGLRKGTTFYVPFQTTEDKYELEEYHAMGLTGRVEKIGDAK
jgi:hypothetical protein